MIYTLQQVFPFQKWICRHPESWQEDLLRELYARALRERHAPVELPEWWWQNDGKNLITARVSVKCEPLRGNAVRP